MQHEDVEREVDVEPLELLWNNWKHGVEALGLRSQISHDVSHPWKFIPGNVSRWLLLISAFGSRSLPMMAGR